MWIMQQENDIFFKYPAGHYVLKSFSMLSAHSRLHNFLLIWMHRSSISFFRNHLRGQMKYLCHPPQGQGRGDWPNHLLSHLFLTGDPAGQGTHLHGARVRLVKGWMEVRLSAQSSSTNTAETPKKKTKNPHVKKKKEWLGSIPLFSSQVVFFVGPWD